MLETHPYGNFVPQNARFLILGSFPAKDSFDWFYGSKRSQFWKILEKVYNINLPDKKSKKNLLSSLQIAMSDIIFSCDRTKNSSLDMNLKNIELNIAEILSKNKIQKIYFTSRFVENKFKKYFSYKNEELITLPSPSPRYAMLTKEEKVKIYKKLLPKLSSK